MPRMLSRDADCRGAGSIPGRRRHKPLYRLMHSSKTTKSFEQAQKAKRGFRDVRFFAPFRIIVEKDIGCVLLFNGLM